MSQNDFHVVVILFEIHLPYSHSLKEKRMAVKSIKDRLSKKLNISIAEVGHLESWQRSQIACTAVSADRKILQQLHSQVENSVIENLDGELIYCDLEWL